MSEYKEFQGKTLDEAIRDACAFYDTPREKLEIDIVSDAKGGIFGLVGARKALIKARRVELSSVLDELDAAPAARREEPAPALQKAKPSVNKEPRNEASAAQAQPAVAPVAQAAPAAQVEQTADAASRGTSEAREVTAEQADGSRRERSSASRRGRGGRKGPASEVSAGGETSPGKQSGKDARDSRSRRGRQDQPKAGGQAGGKCKDHVDHDGSQGKGDPFSQDGGDAGGDDLPRVPFDQLDAEQLLAVTREVISRLTVPLLGEVAFEATCASDRVRVSISGLEDPGVLIGRDGQTLSSMQYLATRMVSNRMKALVRVQIDAGDYRERQDERLRELALSLADKVKAGGKPQLTRPLSSYHRRVIHMTLQDDPMVQTHSKGDGEMKRVVVAPRRKQDKPA